VVVSIEIWLCIEDYFNCDVIRFICSSPHVIRQNIPFWQDRYVACHTLLPSLISIAFNLTRQIIRFSLFVLHFALTSFPFSIAIEGKPTVYTVVLYALHYFS
jgi:hypothetical protein